MPTDRDAQRAEIAEAQLKRLIESRSRFFERERANEAADLETRVQARVNHSAKEAANARERAAYYRKLARTHVRLAREARDNAGWLRSSASARAEV
jgi:hypothetical protein